MSSQDARRTRKHLRTTLWDLSSCVPQSMIFQLCGPCPCTWKLLEACQQRHDLAMDHPGLPHCLDHHVFVTTLFNRSILQPALYSGLVVHFFRQGCTNMPRRRFCITSSLHLQVKFLESDNVDTSCMPGWAPVADMPSKSWLQLAVSGTSKLGARAGIPSSSSTFPHFCRIKAAKAVRDIE